MTRLTRTPGITPRLLASAVGFAFVLVAASGAVQPDPAESAPQPTSGIAITTDGTSAWSPPVSADSPSERLTPTPTPTSIPDRIASASPAQVIPPPTPTPEPTPELDPPARPGPFAIDLYEEDDFVSQATKAYCVPASMQTMMNIIDEGADLRAEAQKPLYTLARDLSTDRLRGDGAEPEGWARALDELGYGPYEVDEAPSLRAAITRAAKALRLSGRPVGLLMWRGAHAWVMSGFKATADPAFTNEFEVTHVYIEDPWYPRVSSIWGASRPPDSLVPVTRLDEDYLRWRRPTVRYPEKDGLFVLVVPLPAPTT